VAENRAARGLAGRRILLGVTGGIAAYKSVFLLRLLTQAGADVQVVMTPAATRFVGPETFAALSHRPVHSDVFERTDDVLHVKLAHEADLAVVAPATATLALSVPLPATDGP
jgi:phosphopantothenoylcysteine decarboxylase/phosphopantothenate--cysteine ligase